MAALSAPGMMVAPHQHQQSMLDSAGTVIFLVVILLFVTVRCSLFTLPVWVCLLASFGNGAPHLPLSPCPLCHRLAGVRRGLGESIVLAASRLSCSRLIRRHWIVVGIGDVIRGDQLGVGSFSVAAGAGAGAGSVSPSVHPTQSGPAQVAAGRPTSPGLETSQSTIRSPPHGHRSHHWPPCAR